MKKSILKFHTGRGGRHYNQGFVSFVDFEAIDKGCTFNDVFLSDDGKTCLSQAGNELDFQINEDGTGWLDEDGEYNTTTCEVEDDLTLKQINALVRAKDNHWNVKEINRILDEHYPGYN